MEVLRTGETLWNASRTFFARWNLSPSQFNVLNLLRLSGKGCTQVELSRELMQHRSNVTGLVDRLEARGLVRRRDIPTDRRAFQVSLTDKGEKLLHEILPHYFEAAESVWGTMPVERARELVTELQAISASATRVSAGKGSPAPSRRILERRNKEEHHGGESG
jgi:MarR family transcriptional repressor of emrRAB